MDRDVSLLLTGAGISLVSTLSGIVVTLGASHLLELRAERVIRAYQRAARTGYDPEVVERLSRSAVRLTLPSQPPRRQRTNHLAAARPRF